MLLETLSSVDLQHYYSCLTEYGVTTVERLACLTMQDYSQIGIVSMDDRKRLIQTLKNKSQPALATSTKLSTIPLPSIPIPIQQPVVPQSIPQADSPPSFKRQVSNPDSPPQQSSFTKRAPLLNAYGIPIINPKTTSTLSLKPKTDQADRIKVCVRKRPLSRKELKRSDPDTTNVFGKRQIQVVEPKVKVDLTKYNESHNFTFDEVFDHNATNEDVYKRTAQPLVEYIFTGGKATCFAYGQTGSGKTFTMLDQNQGLYVLAAKDIFALLELPENQNLRVFVSFYEIYQGHLYDLLNSRKKLYAREDGRKQVCITGLMEKKCDDISDLIGVFDIGSGTRSTGATGANSDSSRSHAIFQIVLRKMGKSTVQGKFSFIDLAGSERGADRGEADKQTRMEGSEINKSLLALKECIRALDLDSKHTPFRQSKLTQVLKDSFIGNSKTCMIATVSPSLSNSEHTLNTLRYADRVKELKGDGNEESFTDDAQESPYYPEDGDEEDELEDNLLDQEFPPAFEEGISSDENEPIVSKKRKSSPTRPLSSKNEKCDFDVVIDELVRLHKASINTFDSSSRREKNLIVGFATGGGESVSLDEYLQELDQVLNIKQEKINQMRAVIGKIKGV